MVKIEGEALSDCNCKHLDPTVTAQKLQVLGLAAKCRTEFDDRANIQGLLVLQDASRRGAFPNSMR